MKTWYSSLFTLTVALAASVALADGKPTKIVDYEVWGADQSNSVPDQTSLGVKGSYLWIWDSASMEAQIEGTQEATPLPCTPRASEGPCNLMEIFPANLAQVNADGETGSTLGKLAAFGRLHGTRRDPTSKYVLANIFARGGGYVGIIDTRTKEAIALFRVTSFAFTGGSGDRSVHMSFWSTGTCIQCNTRFDHVVMLLFLWGS